jgi:hypothetical protein
MLLNAFQMHSYCRSVLPSTFSQCLPNALPPPKHLSVSSKRLPSASQCLSMPVHAFQTPSSSSQRSRCFSMPSKRFPVSLNVSQCFSMPSKHLPIAAQCFPALLNVSLCLPNTPPLPKHLSMSSERPPSASQCLSMPSKYLHSTSQCFSMPFNSQRLSMLPNASQSFSMPSKRFASAPNAAPWAIQTPSQCHASQTPFLMLLNAFRCHPNALLMPGNGRGKGSR